MCADPIEESAGPLESICVFSMNLDPGCHKRAQQEGPDRALMIGAISLQQTAFVPYAIARIVRRQRAESDRGHELFFDETKNLLRAVRRDQVVN